MKKKVEDGSGSSRMKRVSEKEVARRRIRELCEKIVWLFDLPANQGIEGSEVEISTLIDKISPWQNIPHDTDEEFEKFWSAIKVSFGFGYALGQMLDLPDIDITPIKELLREKKALLYMPHERKAA